MKLFFLFTVLAAFMGLFVSGGPCAADDLKARAKYGASPHSDSGDCGLCHVASAEILRSWFVFGSTKRKLTRNPVEVCSKCHGMEFGHGIGRKPSVNHASLPLAGDGTITCATTCHSMHIRSDDSKQTFYHLRQPVDSLCISCHDT